MEEQLYNIVRLNLKVDEPPAYTQGVTLKEIFAYYFNWHTGQETATIEEIKQWFKDKRGWTWEKA